MEEDRLIDVVGTRRQEMGKSNGIDSTLVVVVTYISAFHVLERTKDSLKKLYYSPPPTPYDSYSCIALHFMSLGSSRIKFTLREYRPHLFHYFV